MPRLEHVQSVERTFAIIEALKERGALGIAELAEQLSLDRSTVHRLLSTLRHLGYVNQDPETLKYSNSLKFFDIGNSVQRSFGLAVTARPFMKALADETGEGVNLAVLQSYCMVYLEKIESSATISVNVPLGAYIPAYCTGLGKMLLSGLPDEEIRAVFSDSDERAVRGRTSDHLKIRRYTDRTLAGVEALCAELKKIREQGYSVDDEEYVEGLYCMAAPVRSFSGQIVAAMSVAVPLLGRGTQFRRKRESILPRLIAAANGVSAALGWRGQVFS